MALATASRSVWASMRWIVASFAVSRHFSGMSCGMAVSANVSGPSASASAISIQMRSLSIPSVRGAPP